MLLDQLIIISKTREEIGTYAEQTMKIFLPFSPCAICSFVFIQEKQGAEYCLREHYLKLPDIILSSYTAKLLAC
jgi:hypothetical protein